MGKKREVETQPEAPEWGIAQELRALRKGKGLSTVKFAQCPTILSYFDPDDVAESLRQFLDFVIPRDMRWKDGALCNAFGISYTNPRTLTYRRAEFAAAHGKSVDTVRNWESLMIYELSELKFQVLYAASPRPDVVAHNLGVERDPRPRPRLLFKRKNELEQ